MHCDIYFCLKFVLVCVCKRVKPSSKEFSSLISLKLRDLELDVLILSSRPLFAPRACFTVSCSLVFKAFMFVCMNYNKEMLTELRR